jgi:hypothetical protein
MECKLTVRFRARWRSSSRGRWKTKFIRKTFRNRTSSAPSVGLGLIGRNHQVLFLAANGMSEDLEMVFVEEPLPFPAEPDFGS